MDDVDDLINKEPVDFMNPEGGVDQSAVNFSAKTQKDFILGGGKDAGKTESIQGQQFKTLLGVLKNEDEAVRVGEKLRKTGEGEFSESKARDESGDLAIVWHGSPRIFDSFDPNASGEWSSRNKGIHFQTDKELVRQYTEKGIESVRTVLNEIGYQEIGNNFDPSNPEHFRIAMQRYNDVAEDLIKNGAESNYYFKTDNSFQKDHLRFKNKRIVLNTYREIFGGSLPSLDNSQLVDGPFGTKFYYGKDMGKALYAVVLNIKQPFIKETQDMDNGFEAGEESHEEAGTDGTILNHTNNLVGNGGMALDSTAGTSSYGVFDPEQIKIIGREINGKFELMPEFQVS